MTSPLTPEEQRRNWLLRYLGLQAVYDRKVIAALKHAQYDAGQAAKKWQGMNIGDRTKRYQINLVKHEIHKIIRELFAGLGPVIKQGQRDAAEAAMRAQLAEDAKVLRALFPDRAERKAWQEASVETARRNITIMVNRVTGVSANVPAKPQGLQGWQFGGGHTRPRD